MIVIMKVSRVPVPIHVNETHPEGNVGPNFVETSVGRVVVPDHFPMSPITKWSVR